ncbi:MAG: DUF2510 domain-containing protein [Microthrixaceae bacterium]
MTNSPPPGWYQDPDGVTRWWDGTQWGQAAPPPAPTPPPAPGFQPSTSPQPTGFQPAAQSFGAAPQPLEAGAAFSYGWKKFTEHWKEFLLILVVVALVTLVGTVVAFAALLPAMSGNTTSMVLGWIGYSVAILLVLAISFVVQAGVYRAGLAVTRGVAPSLGMLVETTNLGTYIGTVLIVAVASTIGMFLCVLPGIAVLFFCAYAPLIALDKGVGPAEAIRRSIDLVKDNLGQVFVILLLAYAVYYVGALACYVGLLVSIPVALVMITYSYRVLEGEPVTP